MLGCMSSHDEQDFASCDPLEARVIAFVVQLGGPNSASAVRI
jgi:hypothetical protein